MDLKRYAPHVVKHPNRPDPPERIKCKPDVVVWHDNDTVCIHHMTRRDAERVYEACLNSPRLFHLTYVLGSMLGFDQTEDYA